MERPSQWRGRNNPPTKHNHLHRYDHSNGLYPAGESNTFENGTHKFLPARRKYQGRRRSDVRCQCPRAVRGGNQINGYLSASCRIEFGSVGNLAEEVISGSAHVRCSNLGASPKAQGSTVVMMRERYENFSHSLTVLRAICIYKSQGSAYYMMSKAQRGFNFQGCRAVNPP